MNICNAVVRNVVAGRFVVLLSLALFAWPAHAFSQTASDQLTQNTYQGVSYYSGGIGEEELEKVRQSRGEFRLKLVFADHDGAYLADINVAILDSKGRSVLSAFSEGPLMLVKLQPGKYQVKAIFGREAITRPVTISRNRLSELIFRW